jgi:hypothetical protein
MKGEIGKMKKRAEVKNPPSISKTTETTTLLLTRVAYNLEFVSLYLNLIHNFFDVRDTLSQLVRLSFLRRRFYATG